MNVIILVDRALPLWILIRYSATRRSTHDCILGWGMWLNDTFIY